MSRYTSGEVFLRWDWEKTEWSESGSPRKATYNLFCRNFIINLNTSQILRHLKNPLPCRSSLVQLKGFLNTSSSDHHASLTLTHSSLSNSSSIFILIFSTLNTFLLPSKTFNLYIVYVLYTIFVSEYVCGHQSLYYRYFFIKYSIYYCYNYFELHYFIYRILKRIKMIEILVFYCINIQGEPISIGKNHFSKSSK